VQDKANSISADHYQAGLVCARSIAWYHRILSSDSSRSLPASIYEVFAQQCDKQDFGYALKESKQQQLWVEGCQA